MSDTPARSLPERPTQTLRPWSRETDAWRWMGPKEQARVEIDRRIAFIPQVRTESIAAAGHMLHHDQPERLAVLIEEFL